MQIAHDMFGSACAQGPDSPFSGFWASRQATVHGGHGRVRVGGGGEGASRGRLNATWKEALCQRSQTPALERAALCGGAEGGRPHCELHEP